MDEADTGDAAMRRGKLHYNADRWFAYCADRMGWQIGHWINATTDGLPGNVAGRLNGDSSSGKADARTPARAPILQGLHAGVTPGPSTFNGTKADAVATKALRGAVVAPAQPAAHLPPGTDAASSSTPSVFRTRHQRGGETVDE